MSKQGKRDYYDVLGISKDASENDIKLAYRRLAKKLHPDMNRNDPNSKDKFIELQEAYEVISDSKKRENYDRFGFRGVNVDMSDIFSGGIPGINDIFRSIFGGGGGGGGGGLGDIFGSFGGGRRRSRPRRPVGEDMETRIQISFEEAMFGVKKDIEIERHTPCDACEGSGAEDKSSIKTCPKCQGSGRVRKMTQSGFGTIIREIICNECQGKGEIIAKKCKVCNGKKVVLEKKSIHLSIPPGVEDGMHLKMQGAGHIPSTNAIPGDLFIGINVINNKNFIKRGNDLYTRANIDIVTAILGGKKKISTLDYKELKIIEKEINIPAGTQFGTEFRIKNHGVTYLRGKGRGDQYIIANIKIPKKVSKEQKELLQKFRNLFEK